MESQNKTIITVQATINAPLDKVWEYWTTPEHITKWNFASDDWHSPKAENDLRVGGKFSYQMAAKDGSFSFDFWGIYDEVSSKEHLAITLGDNRKMSVNFIALGTETMVIESFEAESVNPIEMQEAGWQAILNNFKKYVEGN